MTLADGRILHHPLPTTTVASHPIRSSPIVTNTPHTLNTPTLELLSPPSASDLADAISVQSQQAADWERLRVDHINTALTRVGLKLPQTAYPSTVRTASDTHYLLNKPLQAVLSEYIRRTQIPLREFVEPVRFQTSNDYRPNKAIDPTRISSLCGQFAHLDELLHIFNEGFRVHLTEPLPYQHSPPKNHNSALELINILRKNLRKEQDQWRSLVLDDDICVIWPEVFYSPFGVANKGAKPPTEAGRTIHDLSYPLSASVNALTDASTIIRPTYKHYDMIAKEILTQPATHPGVEIKLQTGDAASAFRNIGVHSHSAHVFGGHIEEEHALVIDLCAAFGWTGSPGTYGVFGDALSHIHGRTANAIHTPGFFNYHWVDDHVNVAPDFNANCSEIDRSLRSAMCSVLGADGINEDKFTPWATQHKVLGLIFNTNTKTVSMPDTTIQKARILVAQTFHTASLSRGEYRSLMGSLRHVATCVQPARAFLQRLRQKEHLLNRYSRVTVSNDMRQDLLWWWNILNTDILNGIPMTFFNALPNADITIETDASDSGICAVNRKDRTILVYQFSRQELSLIQEFNCSNL